MLLTFRKESLVKIRKGLKWTTIRKNADRWYGWWERRLTDPPAILQVWEGNPRSGGTFVRDIICHQAVVALGSDFDRWTADADGFDSIDGLLHTLGMLHAMSRGEVLDHRWAIIIFAPEDLL